MVPRRSLTSRFPAGPLLALSALCLWGCPQLLSDDFLVLANPEDEQNPSTLADAGTGGAAGAGSAGAGSAGAGNGAAGNAGVGNAGAGSAGAGSTQNTAGASGAGGSSTTLHASKQTLKPVLDRNLTGNFRSDNVYGDNSCEFADPDATICIGDSSNSNSNYRGFLTFDLSGLPAETQEVSAAQLSMSIDSIRGDPFGALGTLVVERVSFSTINLDALEQAALDPAVNVSSSATVNSTLSADVLSLVQDDALARGRNQLRLRFSANTNSDNAGDLIEVLSKTPVLDVTVLIP
jgi:hypothetical protein